MGASLATLPAFVEPPISRLAPDGRLLACNDAYLALSGYRRDELLNQSFELINHPQMPARVIERMWRTLRAGTPGAPADGPHAGRRELLSQLCVVPLFDGGELVALGTVYHPSAPPRAAAPRHSMRACARAAPAAAGRPRAAVARRPGLGLALALLLGGATLGGHVAPALGGLALALLLGAAWRQAAQRDLQRALGGHAQVYSDALLAPIYRSASSGGGLFEMALNSQKLRMRGDGADQHQRRDPPRPQRGIRATGGQRRRAARPPAAEAEQSAAAIHEMSATIQALSRNLQEAARPPPRSTSWPDGERAEPSRARPRCRACARRWRTSTSPWAGWRSPSSPSAASPR